MTSCGPPRRWVFSAGYGWLIGIHPIPIPIHHLKDGDGHGEGPTHRGAEGGGAHDGTAGHKGAAVRLRGGHALEAV
jgi:hypothetical protein